MITLLKDTVTLKGVDRKQLEAVRDFLGMTSQADRESYGLGRHRAELVGSFFNELKEALELDEQHQP